MNELTIIEKARVFAMYLGAPCYAPSIEPNTDMWEDTHVYQVSASTVTMFDQDNGQIEGDFDFCKLILTPLSRISDEDAIEVAKLQRFPLNSRAEFDCKDDGVWVKFGWHGVGHEMNHKAFQYLIQQGYAVPLFIAPNHPLNGKTAIEMGLAIESPVNPK